MMNMRVNLRVPHQRIGEVKYEGQRRGGGFNEALNCFRDINSKYLETKDSLAWDLYEPYEEYGKGTELKWYFCTFCY